MEGNDQEKLAGFLDADQLFSSASDTISDLSGIHMLAVVRLGGYRITCSLGGPTRLGFFFFLRACERRLSPCCIENSRVVEYVQRIYISLVTCFALVLVFHP
jgi:hypothetical protein